MPRLNNRDLNNLKGSEAVKSMVLVGYDKRKAVKILLKTIKESNGIIFKTGRFLTLESLFVWDNTKQGHDFWSNIFYQKGVEQ